MKIGTKTFLENRALSLLFINLILALGILVQKDPFQLFVKTYETSEKFYKANPSEITKLTYKRKGEEGSPKTLQIQNSTWKVSNSSGTFFLAEEEKVNQLIKALLDARKYTIASSGKDKFSEYGLDSQDTFYVELFKGDSSLGVMALGNAGGGGSFTHVLWNDSEEIYVVEDSIKPLLGRGADDYFMNKRITPLNVNSSDLFSISLRSKTNKKSYSLLKKDSKWFADGSDLELPNEKISGLLNKLSSLIADSVMDRKDLPSLKDTEGIEIQFSYQEASSSMQKSITLKILGKDTTDYYYIEKEGDNLVYKFQDYQLKSILQTDF